MSPPVDLRGRTNDEVYAWTRAYISGVLPEASDSPGGRRRRRRVSSAASSLAMLQAIPAAFYAPQDGEADGDLGSSQGSHDEFTEPGPNPELWEITRGTWTVTGGHLVAGDDGSRVPVIQWIGPGANKVDVRIRFELVSGDQEEDGWAMGYVRGVFDQVDGFSGYTVRAEPDRIVISRWDDDVETELVDVAATPVAGDLVEIEVNGDELAAIVNHAEVATAQDATYATGASGLAALHDSSLKDEGVDA